jgi:hypothetical protein
MGKRIGTKPDGLRAGYAAKDFPKGLARGKYAARVAKESNIVRLDPEIHAAFPTSEAVNEALGGLLRVAKTARLKRSTRPAKTHTR